MWSKLPKLSRDKDVKRLQTIVLGLTVFQPICIVFAFFLFHWGNTLHDGVQWDDVIDMFVSPIIVSLLWILFASVARNPVPTRDILLFLVISTVFIQGEAIHLVADSIGNAVGEDRTTPGGSLIYFYDEVLGHYLWQAGIFGNSVLTLWRAWFSQKAIPMENAAIFWIGGGIYGFTFFVSSIQGQTLFLSAPAAFFVMIASIWRLRSKKSLGPVGVAFALAYAITLVLLAVWGIWYQGFPKPTKVLSFV